MQLIEQTIMCPYCGESIEILIDDSSGVQDYFEDCSVCCRPIRIQLDTDSDGNYQYNILRDDE
jgi:hypothetical protein